MGENPSHASLNANATSFEPRVDSGSTQNTNPYSKNKSRRRNKNRRQNNRKPKNASKSEEQQEGESNAIPSGQGKGRRLQQGGRKGRKKYPWRKFIPQGTMDPITLENLISLEYPPFALVATAPYTPVPIWPIPQTTSSDDEGRETTESVEDINRQRLQEQWGNSVVTPAEEEAKKQEKEEPLDERHLHLYDGRALAYYLVSQLQFIDPLNRRDLTRPELLNLDAYLHRNGFHDIRVTEAYDAKGVTLSSAGAAADTPEGRAEILQQIATNLLNSLFGDGQSVPTPSARSPPSSLQEQYAAMRLQEEEARRRQQAMPFASDMNPFDTGIHDHEDGGFEIVDDDENPGLRGDGDCATDAMREAPANQLANADAQCHSQGPSHPFYSARHIVDRYGAGRRSFHTTATDAFPALPTAAAPVTRSRAGVTRSRNGILRVSKVAPASTKTLSRITGACYWTVAPSTTPILSTS